MNKDEAQRTMMGSYLTGLRKATFGLFVMGGLWAAGGYGIAGITCILNFEKNKTKKRIF
jgi:hypothetical protein